MAVVLGINAKAYVSEDGSTWSELSNIRDVTLNLEKSEADITTRGGNGYRQSIGTLKDGGVDFEMIWDTADTNFGTIKDAFFDDESLHFKFLDGQDGEGLQAEFSVVNFSRSEALEEALMVDVSIKITKGTTTPSWVTPSSSSSSTP